MDSLTLGISEFWFLNQAVDFQYTIRRKLPRLKVETLMLRLNFADSVTCGTNIS